jgi:hypothetical protein
LDGLSDDNEAAYGTNVAHPDTDGDGFTDGYEASTGYDPLNDLSHPEYDYASRFNSGGGETTVDRQDPDLDGLPTSFEEEIGTAPDSGDTDGDGIMDGVELANGLDPLVVDESIGPDDDNDGLGNSAEGSFGASASSADMDKDGLSDLYEVLRGFNPQHPDSDNDGVLDGYETGPFDYRYSPKLWQFG